MEIPTGGGALCVRCGDSLTRMDVDSTCPICRLTPPPFARAVAYGPYQGRMRESIHALKYDRLHPVARVLGQMLADAIAQLAGQAPAEMIVVPVPLHRRKLREREFNQSRLLAAEAIRSLRATHPDWRLTLADGLLIRTRVTASQAGLTTRQRRLNVRAAFRVRPGAELTGKHVLIVDDILTTGATARAASRALLDAGAESAWVATLARARRAGFETAFEASGAGAISAEHHIASGNAEGMHAALNTTASQPSL